MLLPADYPLVRARFSWHGRRPVNKGIVVEFGFGTTAGDPNHVQKLDQVPSIAVVGGAQCSPSISLCRRREQFQDTRLEVMGWIWILHTDCLTSLMSPSTSWKSCAEYVWNYHLFETATVKQVSASVGGLVRVSFKFRVGRFIAQRWLWAARLPRNGHVSRGIV